MSSKTLILYSTKIIAKQTGFAELNKLLIHSDFKTRILPFIKRTQKISNNNVIVSMDELSEFELSNANIAFQTINQYISSDSFDDIEEIAMALIENPILMKSVKTLIYRDKNFEFDTWEILNLFLLKKVREALRFIILIERIISIEKPTTIIISDHTINIKRIYNQICIMNDISFQQIPHPVFPKIVMVFQSLIYNQLFHFNNSINVLRNQYKNRNNILHTQHIGLKDKRRKVIVLSDTLRHYHIITPWILEFKNRADNGILVVGGNKAWKSRYEESEIHFSTFSSYLDSNCEKVIRIKAKQLFKEINNFFLDNRNLITMRFHDIPLYPLIKDDIIHYLPKFVFGMNNKSNTAQIVGYVRLIEILKKINEIEKPDVFVIQDFHDWFEKCIIQFSDKNSTKTLMLQHGMTVGGIQDRFVPITKMALFGKLLEKKLLLKGFSNAQLTPTGAPQWDKLYKLSINKSKLIDDLSLNHEKKIILMATEVIEPYAMTETYREVFLAANSLADVQLIFKLHPSDPGLYIDEVAKELKFKEDYIITRHNIHELLLVSDILINMQSTVAIEAIILNIPTISLNFSGGSSRSPFSNDKPIINIVNKGELNNTITTILNDKNYYKQFQLERQSFISNHAFKIDGKSSIRVCNLVDKMIDDD